MRVPSAAEEKALDLLLRLLTRKEREQFARDGYLLVKAGRWPYIAPFGAQFEIHPPISSPNSPYGGYADVRRRNRPLSRACVSTYGRLPLADDMAAYYLAMKARHRAFQQTANWHPSRY